ncbi:MAG: serine/threonine-protein kinase [Myxococcota bacterium]
MSERHDSAPREEASVTGESPERADPSLRATGIRETGTGGQPQGSGTGGGATDATNWIGRVVDDRYEVVEKLGEGGMGAVFVAEHLKLHKRVALKVILPDFAGDGEMAARFAREAMASAKLDHPHVASALDYGTLPEGGAYLVMQLVRGRSLQALIDGEGRLGWPRACSIAAQVADALAAAHAQGIVHRDLKPDNVLLEPRDGGGELVKVLDFGIARVSAEAGQAVEGAAPTRALTRLGTVMGTPGYMSPEQAVGEAVDHRTDLYALGVVLWEMLCGRTLFEGHELTAIVTQQLTQEPPPVRQAAGDSTIPAPLEHLVARLLARSPGDRPAGAAEVRETLQQLAYGVSPAAGLPVGAITGTHPHLGAVAAPAAGGETGGTATVGSTAKGGGLPDTVRIAGRHIPVPVVAAGCAAPLLLAGLVTVLVMAFGGEEDTSAPPSHKIARLLNPGQALPLPKPTPPEVQERVDTVLGSDSRAERRRAAKWLQEHEPADEVPEHAQLAAELETARGCRGKKKVLAKMREAGNGKVLPALERLASSPKRGCGFLRTADCYACLRSELADTIDELD